MLKKLTALAVAGCVALLAGAAWSAEEDPGERTLEILRTTNKAQINKYYTKVYDVKNVNPFNLVRWLTRQIQPEDGAFWTFMAPDGESGKVLVVVPKHQIASIDAFIASADRPKLTSSSGTMRAYVPLKHRSTSDVDFIDTLSQSMQFGSSTVLTDRATNSLYLEDTPLAVSDTLAALEEKFDLPTPEVMVDVTIYEVQANNDATMGLDFHAWKNGPGRNLFALGGFAEYESLHNYQIEIEGDPIGFDPAQALIFDSGANVANLPGDRFNSHGYNMAYYLRVPSAYFDSLAVKGQARVVTQTRLSVLNRRQASISSGDKFFYYLTENGPAPTGGIRLAGLALDPMGKTDGLWGSGYGAYGYPYPVTTDDMDYSAGIYDGYIKPAYSYPDNRTVTGTTAKRRVTGSLKGQGFDRDAGVFEETYNEAGQPVKINNQLGLASSTSGVFLDVVPSIGENLITMALRYSVVNMTGFDGEGRPQLVARSVEDTVRARDGQEILIGGLTRQARVQQSSKVPVLGSLPILGYLFGGETTTAQQALAVVVLKPTVVQNFSNTAADAGLINAVNDTYSPAGAELPENDYGWDMYFIDRQERGAGALN